MIWTLLLEVEGTFTPIDTYDDTLGSDSTSPDAVNLVLAHLATTHGGCWAAESRHAVPPADVAPN